MDVLIFTAYMFFLNFFWTLIFPVTQHICIGNRDYSDYGRSLRGHKGEQNKIIWYFLLFSFFLRSERRKNMSWKVFMYEVWIE